MPAKSRFRTLVFPESASARFCLLPPEPWRRATGLDAMLSLAAEAATRRGFQKADIAR